MSEQLVSSQASFFCLRKQDINSIIIGSSDFWEKSQKVSEILGELGTGEDADKLKI